MTGKESAEGAALPCKNPIGKVPHLWRSVSSRNPIPASRPGLLNAAPSASSGLKKVPCFKPVRSISSAPAKAGLCVTLVSEERLQICLSLDTGCLQEYTAQRLLTVLAGEGTRKTEDEDSKRFNKE